MTDRSKLVYEHTKSKLNFLLHDLSGGPQKAMLAQLRRGVGRKPGEIPELWGAFLEGLPDALCGSGGNPSRTEWAIYVALTLFAAHQQGRDPSAEPMNREGCRFGSAIAQLITDENERERIIRRFNIVATASEMPELAHHLRGAVQLLRGDGIPVDYAELAKDLYWYQAVDYRSNVRLRWGEDFYRQLNKTGKEETDG